MKFAKVPIFAFLKKRWVRTILIVFLLMLLIPIILYGIIRTSRVQTWLAGQATSYLAKELKADVSIKGVDISWFMKVTLEGFYLSDLKKDTLLYVGRLGIVPNNILYRQRILDIHKLILEDAKINIKTYKNDSSLNIQFLLDYFTSSDTTKTTQGKPWDVKVYNVDLVNVNFNLDDENRLKSDTGIDFSHLHLSNVNLALRDIKFKGENFDSEVRSLSMKETNGFNLKNLKAQATIRKNYIDLKNLEIITDRSNLGLDLHFGFTDYSAFNDFINKINIQASFLPSHIDTRDITFFAPQIWGMDNQVLITGDVSGKVTNIKLKDFALEFGATSRFHGNLKMTGLPNFEETFINLDIKDLVTNTLDLEQINLPGREKIVVPEQLKKLGRVSIKGKFTGFYNDFVSYANFRTDLGKVFTDLSLKNNKDAKRFEYQGTVKTENFNLGKLIGTDNVMRFLDMNADIKGSGLTLKTLAIEMKGTIDSTDLLGKTYRKIDIAGGINNQTFTGSLHVIDPDLGLDFNGAIDFNKDHPSFHFDSRISHARLNRLHLIKSDTLYEFSALVSVNTEGIVLDSMQGQLEIDSLVLKVNQKVYTVNTIGLAMIGRRGDYKEISLKSSLVDADVKGKLNFRKLDSSFRQLAANYLPSLFHASGMAGTTAKQDFTFSVNLKDPDPLMEVLFPGIKCAQNTTISGEINNKTPRIKLAVSSKIFSFGNHRFTNFYTNGNTVGDLLIVDAGCRKYDAGGTMHVDSLKFTSRTRNDSINFRFSYNNLDTNYINKGNIGGSVSFPAYPKIRVVLNQSGATINDTLWTVNNDNLIEIDSNFIHINNFTFSSGFSSLTLDGTMSDNPLDEFTVNINNLDISNFDMFTEPIGFNFDGLIFGQARIRNIYHSPKIISDITIKKFGINGDFLGDAVINSSWDPKESALYAGLDVIYKGNVGVNQPIKVVGHFYPLRKKDNLDFTADLNNFRLKSIQNLLSSFSSKLVGIATGHLSLKGSLAEPELTGTVKVQRGEIKIDYLKTTYSFSHDIILSKDAIEINDVTAFDSLGNQAIINGKVKHHSFREWALDLDIQTKNFLSMNTRFVDNNLFYGTAFGSGHVTIKGPTHSLVFNISATTTKGTQFYLPLNLTADISDKSYIIFVNPRVDSTLKEQEYKTDLSGLTMFFNLDATPDAEVNLYLPYDMGNIKARGEGRIYLTIDSKSGFGILGEYKVTEGDYLFNLRNLLTRNFELIPGGRIIFNGDIYSTKLDLRAKYKMEASLSALKPAGSTDPIYKEKVPIDCIIDLKGNLFNPEITFKLEVKESDPLINRIVFSQIDTNNQQMMSEQMIFLLVLKQFKPIDPNGAVEFGQSAAASSYEMLASQVSNWLSQISNRLEIGVNYRPGDQVSTDELTVALSTKLFDQRVKIDGNFGMASTAKNPAPNSQSASNLVGDVSIEYKVTPDGRVYIKGYNKSNNMELNQNRAPYTQGFGIYYRREFDHLSEIFRKTKSK